MFELTVESPGLDAAIDVTDSVADALRSRSVRPGMTHVFLRGSSVALIAMRFEPGTVRDLQEALETLAPVTKSYAHELTTGDRNGFAHVRSALLGTSLSLPWAGDTFDVSDTHRIVLFDFDLKPAVRTLVIDSSQGTGNR
jgi:secondary thiamine-phosphate synthase enzyme